MSARASPSYAAGRLLFRCGLAGRCGPPYLVFPLLRSDAVHRSPDRRRRQLSLLRASLAGSSKRGFCHAAVMRDRRANFIFCQIRNLFAVANLPGNHMTLPRRYTEKCVAHKNSSAMQQMRCFRNRRLAARLSIDVIAMEGRRVNVTMKLNMLAVCAAFVFVGAIVLGAF
jgi:hypothetical protein